MSMNSRRRVVSIAALSAAALACSALSTADAAPITWVGTGTTTNWSDGGNWGGTAPVSGDSLTFDGGTAATNVNDLAAGTNIAGITWAATSTVNWSHTGTTSNNLSGDLTYARGAGSATITTPFVLQQNITVDVASGGTLTSNGAFTGAFAVTKTGPGLFIAGGANLHSAGLNVNGGTYRGTLAGSTNANYGTGTISLSNGAGLELRNTNSVTFNNALNLGTGGGTIYSRGSTTFSPTAITGSGTLTLGGTGASAGQSYTITPTSFQSWSGQVNVTVPSGQNMFLRLATGYVNSSALNVSLDLAASANVTRQNGSSTTQVIDLGALSGVAGSTFGGSAAGGGMWLYSIGSLNTSTTFAGNYNDGSTKTGLRKVGTGTLTLAGTASTFSGASEVNSGTLNVTGNLTSAALVLTVNNGGTLTADGSIAGRVVVNDGGILGGSGTIAGNITVNAGGTIARSITVNAGSTLGGSGTITGTVNSVGGTIAPGTSPGTLTVGGMTLNGASILNYELNGGNTTVGGGVNDLIAVTPGGLTLDGTINISETVAGSFATASGGTWTLFTVAGTLVDNGLVLGTVPTLPAGGSLSIDTLTPGQVNLVLSVPEPTSLLVLGAAGLLAMKRRR